MAQPPKPTPVGTPDANDASSRSPPDPQPTEWIRLCRVSDIPLGAQRYHKHGVLELAIFHLTDPDQFVVVRNSCPHAGGNMSAGTVSAGIVACPWHQWEFDLRTGGCVHNPDVRLTQFPTRVDGEWLMIQR